MAEITKEQVGWLCHRADGARDFVWFASDPDELSWLRKRYVRFDPLIVQQEGMVLVPRDLLTAAGLTLPADSPNAKRIWAILNAASERDQRGAERLRATTAKSPPEVETSACDEVRTHKHIASAPHPSTDLLRGIALGIEAAAKRADGRHRYEVARDIRSLNPADIAAKNPEKGQP